MSKNEYTGTVGRTSDPVSKPHTMEELVPSSVPLTIPYFEVYRTNELEYVEYQSPYLNQSQDSGDGSQEVSDDSYSSENGSGDTGTSDTKSQFLKELSKIVERYFPNISNKDDWVGQLRNAKLNWTSVSQVTNKMAKKSKINGNQNGMIEEVLQAKENASGIKRSSNNSNKILNTIAKTGNTKKGKLLITALKSSNDTSLKKMGDIYKTITINYK